MAFQEDRGIHRAISSNSRERAGVDRREHAFHDFFGRAVAEHDPRSMVELPGYDAPMGGSAYGCRGKA